MIDISGKEKDAKDSLSTRVFYYRPDMKAKYVPARIAYTIGLWDNMKK